MSCMARLDKGIVQNMKFEFILNYINKICPRDYCEDAMKIVNSLNPNVDDSQNDFGTIPTVRLAEKLSADMSYSDRMYIMYILLLMYAADCQNTTNATKSERYLLDKFCGKGLDIEIDELDKLMRMFIRGTEKKWYKEECCDKDSRYPSFALVSNISPITKKRIKPFTSISTIMNLFMISRRSFLALTIIFAFVFWRLDSYSTDLMCIYIPKVVELCWWFIPLFLFLLGLLKPNKFKNTYERINNFIRSRGLIKTSICSILIIVPLYYSISNLLFLMANEMFSTEETIAVNKRIEGTKYIYNSKGKNSYLLKFSSFDISKIAPKNNDRKVVSFPNSLYLSMLPYLTGFSEEKLDNMIIKSMSEVKVRGKDYDNTKVNDTVKLKFKYGYYGMIFYDSYEIIYSSKFIPFF